MRLYTNSHGSWVGTQSDAKREFGKDWKEVDVPTDKPNLLKYLNDEGVSGRPTSIPMLEKKIELDKRISGEARRYNLQSCSANTDVREAASLNQYDVTDVVLNCPKQHLSNALAAIISRLNDQLGEI